MNAVTYVGIALTVEQSTRNGQVAGSNPVAGTIILFQ